MKRIDGIKYLMAILLTTILTVSITLQSNLTASSSIITVPDDYPTIQEAIDAAHDGDTIVVRAGQYDGNITIDKPLDLIGEDKETTIIDGNYNMFVLLVKANYVNITGFTIQNSTRDIKAIFQLATGGAAGGISLVESIGCTITNNTIRTCAAGVAICMGSGNITVSENRIIRYADGMTAFGVSNFYGSGSNTIYDNDITDLTNGIFFMRDGASNNKITKNRIDCPGDGISLLAESHSCTNNIVTDNIIRSSGGNGVSFKNLTDNIISNNTVSGLGWNLYGIFMEESHNNIISNNTITGGSLFKNCRNSTLRSNSISDFQVEGSELSHFLNDVDTSNTIDGKPIYYLVNQTDLSIDLFAYPNIGFLGLINSEKINVRGLRLTGKAQGMLLAQTSDSEIAECYLSDNEYGIYLWNCSENTIVGSMIVSSGTAINMRLCESNVVRGNTFLNNDVGMHLFGSCDNTFHRNNFMDNSVQIIRYDELYNSWDDRTSKYGPFDCPVCSELRPVGNYWSDYTGLDDGTHTQVHNCPGDEVGDTDLPHQEVDYYPLMKPWVPVFGDTDYNGKVTILDVAAVAKNYGKISP